MTEEKEKRGWERPRAEKTDARRKAIEGALMKRKMKQMLEG